MAARAAGGVDGSARTADGNRRSIGLRPGEKVAEEWRLDRESPAPTSHDAIKVLCGDAVEWEQLQPQLEALRRAADRRDVAAVVTVVQRIVPEYTPGDTVRRLAAGDISRGTVLARPRLHPRATTSRPAPIGPKTAAA